MVDKVSKLDAIKNSVLKSWIYPIRKSETFYKSILSIASMLKKNPLMQFTLVVVLLQCIQAHHAFEDTR
jgi:hypothetical protein